MATLIFVLVLVSIGLTWGGVVDMNNHDVAPCTITKVSNCGEVCVDTGGGGGGEKRGVEQVDCRGAQFLCSVEWTIDDQTYQQSGLQASWYTDDYSCATVSPGIAAVVVYHKSYQSQALDVEPTGYSRPPAMLIVGLVFLSITFCLATFSVCFYKMFKDT